MSPQTADRSIVLVDRLLGWFDKRDRDVPWRTEADPFAILVAEIMAQQTRIETVRPYYAKFRTRFPTVVDLAEADQDEVLRLWEGLGYYARARNLHEAAKVIVEHHGSEVPQTAAALRALPGVGPYTAGAVASLAFGAVEPAVDGNARRVLSRAFDLEDAAPTALDRTARELLRVCPERAGAMNQAIMDLGSEVCVPKRPDCDSCPISLACLALRRGSVALRPARKPKPKKPLRRGVAAVIAKGTDVFVVQRPRDGLLGGLWDFPNVPLPPEERAPTNDWLEGEIEIAFGLVVSVGRPIHTIKHTFTHFCFELSVCEAEWRRGEASASTQWLWAGARDLQRLAFPIYHRRMIDSVLAAPGDHSKPVGTS